MEETPLVVVKPDMKEAISGSIGLVITCIIFFANNLFVNGRGFYAFLLMTVIMFFISFKSYKNIYFFSTSMMLKHPFFFFRRKKIINYADIVSYEFTNISRRGDVLMVMTKDKKVRTYGVSLFKAKKQLVADNIQRFTNVKILTEIK